MTYHRVTDVLKPFSGMSKIDPAILNAAATRGKFVHDIFDAKQSGMGYPEIPDSWKGYVDSTDLWANAKSILPKPERWFCDAHEVTGECDGIYQDGKDFVLFDLKTSSCEGKTWFLQGSAYAYLARKAGFDVKRIEFIRLKKDGKKPCVYTYEYNFELFLSCLAVYKQFFLNPTEENELDYL